MKILHVYNHFYPCIGGIERHIEDLCLEMIRLGHQSDVCCLNTCANSQKRLKSYEKHMGIGIYRISYNDFKYYKIASLRILKIVKKYDVLHIHGLGFFLDFLSLMKSLHKKPIILSTHGGIFHTKRLMYLKRIYFGLWSKNNLKRVDRIIAVSKNDEKIFSQKSKNVIFIPDGIDFNSYSKIERTPKSDTLLFIGRLSPNKRIDHLIETVYFLKDKMPYVKLYVVGGDWKGNRKTLESLVKNKKLESNLIFTGEISERGKKDYLKKVELFVSASEYEGFGISIVEAMACGLPVVLNDIEPFRNLVKNGENGFIVDYSKPKEAAQKIFGFLNNKKILNKVSQNAKKTAEEYDWKDLVKKIENQYKILEKSDTNAKYIN